MSAFLTTSGLQKFAVATPETPMTVKYMAIGVGTGTPRENMTALFNEVYRLELPNPLRDPDQPKNLEFTGYIPTSVGGWTITELGLFDSTGALVAYDLLDESIVKSGPDSAIKTDMYPTVVLSLSNTEDTQLIVSNSIKFDHAAITNRNHPDAHNIASITGLQGALNQQSSDLNNAVSDANLKDAQNVKITGAQTVVGVKTFSSPIVSTGGNVTAIPIANVTGLQTSLDQKTTDLNLLKSEYDLNKQAKNITANSTLSSTDAGAFVINASSGPITVTLPLAETANSLKYVFMRTDNSTNIVTIKCAGSDAFYGEGATRVSGQIFQYETFTINKLGGSSWSLVRNSNSQIISSAGKPLFNLNGAVAGELALTANILGIDQAYQNVTISRSAGVTYTNGTGRPIFVTVTIQDVQGTYPIQITVAGVIVSTIPDTPSGWYGAFSFIVPAGSTYLVTTSNNIAHWSELR